MTNEYLDKPRYKWFLLGTSLAILIFHFAWFKNLLANFHKPVFLIFDVLLIAAYVIEAIGMLRHAEDEKGDIKVRLVIYLALAICLWTGGWASGVNGNKMMQDDINKAKAENRLNP